MNYFFLTRGLRCGEKEVIRAAFVDEARAEYVVGESTFTFINHLVPKKLRFVFFSKSIFHFSKKKSHLLAHLQIYSEGDVTRTEFSCALAAGKWVAPPRFQMGILTILVKRMAGHIFARSLQGKWKSIFLRLL